MTTAVAGRLVSHETIAKKSPTGLGWGYSDGFSEPLGGSGSFAAPAPIGAKPNTTALRLSNLVVKTDDTRARAIIGACQESGGVSPGTSVTGSAKHPGTASPQTTRLPSGKRSRCSRPEGDKGGFYGR